MLAGYPHFLRTAASLQWDEAAVDLSADAREWRFLAHGDQERITRLVAGFLVGEAAVADRLGPFAIAAARAEVSACFEFQAGDEARHARFFGRYVCEVLRTPGGTPAERAQALHACVEPTFTDLFERKLPEVAGALARDAEGLDAAVAFYHLLLEGVVFTAGQLALLELLDALDALHGLREGLELVIRDENWHVGFGARCLQDLGLGPVAAASLAAEAVAAVHAWGDAVPAHFASRVARLHRRRLGAAGLPATATAA